ncbi:MAG: hypothetical protein IJI73_06955, partial [Kiritimatiellae bacterium]|nr:hypothetical protein [Kiritimatiellia bacterium]
MGSDRRVPGDIACWAVAAVFILGLVVLLVKLAEVQIDFSSDYTYAMARQSTRRVQTDGRRGRILDRCGRVLAGNREAFSISLSAEAFQRRTWRGTAEEMRAAIDRAAALIGRPAKVTDEEIRRHLARRLARPLVVWRDVDGATLARFCEHEPDLPGFACEPDLEREYPYGGLAAHLIGYVGRERGEADEGDVKFDFFEREMCGRAGLEKYYNSFLRGSSGEKTLVVDARGFASEETTVVEAKDGPDLVTTLDAPLQSAVERQLLGLKGACVVLDASNGELLAMASAPSYDLNRFVPTLPRAVYARLLEDPGLPLHNRACSSSGRYAPGSTFKPVTALAGLSAGISPDAEYDCEGSYPIGEWRIRCARTWGHGPLGMREALRDSCNAYFCNLAVESGSNAVISAARALGLGSPTGIDFLSDDPGLVPDDAWKREHRGGERWYPGDLAQMSIGQGMLLATPLQMARVAAAIGTGRLVTPHVKAGLEAPSSPLPFRAS